MNGHRSTMRAVGAAAVIAAAGLGLTGCGSSGPTSNGEASKSAAQILRDAKAATAAASSVRIAGTIVSDGTSTTLDFVDGQGRGGGTIDIGGATLQLVLHAPDLYIEADRASWTQLANASVAAQVAGKWVQTTTADKNFTDFGALLDLPKLTAQFTKASGAIVKGRTTTFHGVPAVSVVDKGSNHGTLYAATTGKPVILGIVDAGKDGGGVRFTSYGTARVPSVPSGAVSLQKLDPSAA